MFLKEKGFLGARFLKLELCVVLQRTLNLLTRLRKYDVNVEINKTDMKIY